MNSIEVLLDRHKSSVVMLACLLVAVVFGVISAKANLFVIILVMALFAAVFLLSRPASIVWLVLFIGMLVVGVAPLFNQGLDPKAGWIVSLLCAPLLPLVFLKIATTKAARQDTPAFIWLLFVFFVVALFNSLAQWHSAEAFVSGCKRYFQIWGLMFALCWMAFDERYIRRWLTFFIIVALVQLPFTLWEVATFVPMREAIRSANPGLVPIDVVAGTFGATLYGGGASGEMSTFLVIVVAFLLSRKMQNTLSLRRFIQLIPWVLAPLFVGETKAVIVMLPLMFMVLYRRELIARPHYGVMALIVGSLLTVGMGYAYLSITHMTLDKLFADTLKYNLYEKGYGVNYLNRTTVLTFWASHQGAHDPISLVFGNGLGSAHEKTGGYIDVRYPRYGIGLTAASTLLWDTGVFGCGLLVAAFASAWHAAGRLYLKSTEPTVRADAAAIQAAISLFVFHIFYRLDLLETVSYQIVFASVLGYLAWLHRQQAASTAARLP